MRLITSQYFRMEDKKWTKLSNSTLLYNVWYTQIDCMMELIDMKIIKVIDFVNKVL